MDELVIMKSEQALTTSLKVAETFNKKHQHVMESIRKLTVENSTVKKMFVLSSYVNSRGQEQPMFYMNRDGFTLLAMGFTGKGAMKFKLEYIQAFNKMEKLIREEKALPQSPEEQLQLTMVVTNRLAKRMNSVEKDNEKNKADIYYLKNKAEIDSKQRFQLRKERNRKAVKVCGGVHSNFYNQKGGSRRVFRALEHDLKEKFKIARYDDLRKDQFDDAIAFIQAWYPNVILKQDIDAANAQTSLHLYEGDEDERSN